MWGDFSPFKASSPSSSFSPRSYLKQYNVVSQNNSGKHGNVFIAVHKKQKSLSPGGSSTFKTPQRVSWKKYAIKAQRTVFDEPGDRAYRERRLFQLLSGLYYQSKCFGFVLLYDYIKCPQSQASRALLSASPGAAVLQTPLSERGLAVRGHTPIASPAKTPQKVRQSECAAVGGPLESPKMLHYVLEYADKRLTDFTGRSGETMELVEYREVVFQILYALFVAGVEHKFTHYDLHSKNILLQRGLPNGSSVSLFVDANPATGGPQEPVWWTVTGNWTAKITDFGLSRAETAQGELLANIEARDRTKQMWDPLGDMHCFAGYMCNLLQSDHLSQSESKEELALLRKEMRSLARCLKKDQHKLSKTPIDHLHWLLCTHEFFAPLQVRTEALRATLVQQAKEEGASLVVVSTGGSAAIPSGLSGCALHLGLRKPDHSITEGAPHSLLPSGFRGNAPSAWENLLPTHSNKRKTASPLSSPLADIRNRLAVARVSPTNSIQRRRRRAIGTDSFSTGGPRYSSRKETTCTPKQSPDDKDTPSETKHSHSAKTDTSKEGGFASTREAARSADPGASTVHDQQRQKSSKTSRDATDKTPPAVVSLPPYSGIRSGKNNAAVMHFIRDKRKHLKDAPHRVNSGPRRAKRTKRSAKRSGTKAKRPGQENATTPSDLGTLATRKGKTNKTHKRPRRKAQEDTPQAVVQGEQKHSRASGSTRKREDHPLQAKATAHSDVLPVHNETHPGQSSSTTRKEHNSPTPRPSIPRPALRRRTARRRLARRTNTAKKKTKRQQKNKSEETTD